MTALMAMTAIRHPFTVALLFPPTRARGRIGSYRVNSYKFSIRAIRAISHAGHRKSSNEPPLGIGKGVCLPIFINKVRKVHATSHLPMAAIAPLATRFDSGMSPLAATKFPL